MKTEYCVLATDPNGNGSPHPVESTIGWTASRCKEAVEQRRAMSPAAKWHVGVRWVDEWCAMPKEKI